MIVFQKKVLKNGLRVILAPMENTEAVTFLVVVGVGSRYEPKEVSGISHFLEHLFFKGTKNRPRPGQINRELDKMGAAHNAFTNKEATSFWVKSAGKDFDKSLDIVSDILLNPLFKKEEIEKERGVILQEIAMYEDLPQRKVWWNLEHLFFGEHPLGWDISGSKETVSGISHGDIVSCRRGNYLAGNMVIAVAGKIDAAKAFGKIEKKFAKVGPGKNKKAKKACFVQTAPRVDFLNKPSDQTHLALGIKSCGWHDEEKYVLNVLSVIFGGNSSSRLFMEIREKMGLCYYVFSGENFFSDIGYLGIGAGVAQDRVKTSLEKIVGLIRLLKTKKVSQNELKCAKSFIRGRTALELEATDDIAELCAFDELFYRRVIQPEEMLEKIEKVNQNDILRVSREIFRPSRINMAVIGPAEDFEKEERFYKNLFKKI